jgi:hypothetical protein
MLTARWPASPLSEKNAGVDERMKECTCLTSHFYYQQTGFPHFEAQATQQERHYLLPSKNNRYYFAVWLNSTPARMTELASPTENISLY